MAKKKKKSQFPLFQSFVVLVAMVIFSLISCLRNMIQAWNMLLTEVQTLHAASVQELLHMLENVLMFNGTKQSCEYSLPYFCSVIFFLSVKVKKHIQLNTF